MTAVKKHRVGIKAFTLLELILIMIILCTVLALAAPSLRGFFSSRQLNDISERILVMTRYAKTQAVFESRYYRVNFDMASDQRRCWISVMNESQYQYLNTSFGNDFKIPSDIKMTFDNVLEESGVNYFEFDPKGYSKAGWVQLEDQQGNIMAVVCNSPSEYFEIAEIVNGEEVYQ